LDDELHVPVGLVQFVVGETVGACLFLWDVESEDWDCLKAKHGCREVASMSYDDHVFFVDNDWLVKPKLPDGGGDLLDLLFRVLFGVLAVRPDVAQRALLDFHKDVILWVR
jgi:hypothetical protein